MSMMIIHRATSATGRHTLKIPVCGSCGDACTVCYSLKIARPHRGCCLSAQLAREGQIQVSTPPEHTNGESGDTFNSQVFAGKPE